MGNRQSRAPPQPGAKPASQPRVAQSAAEAQKHKEEQLRQQEALRQRQLFEQQQKQQRQEAERKKREEEEQERKRQQEEAKRKRKEDAIRAEEKKHEENEIGVKEFDVYDPKENWWDKRRDEPKRSSLFTCFEDNNSTFNLRTNNYISNNKFEFIIDFGKKSLLTFIKGTFGRSQYSAKKLIVFCGKNDESMDGNDWKQIGIWQFVEDETQEKNKNKQRRRRNNGQEFKLLLSKESIDDRYYRFVFEDTNNGSYVEIRRLQFFGDKGEIKQNINKSIKARDFSGCYSNNDKYGIDKIFIKDGFWESPEREKV